MTETETLLTQAREIAWRAFDNPTEDTVMRLFERLCAERDYACTQLESPADDRVLH